MKSRNWLGTLNNPKIDSREYLEKWHTTGKAKYVCGQLEKGHEEGTIHIQFFLNFKEPVRLSQLTKFSCNTHFEIVKVNNGAHDYCMKEDTRLEGPWEFGEKPVSRNNKADWNAVRKAAEEGKFEEIPADIYIKHYLNLKRIRVDNLTTTDREECRGIWLWGPPGTGKTTFARKEYGEDIYAKALNKWWDGYKGQKIVILDDLDSDCLAHYIKIWADKWGATGEVKGGTVALDYDKFIVTSNFSIEELFQKQPQTTIEAINRRFKVTHFNAPLV